jgi:hypothetical protein
MDTGKDDEVDRTREVRRGSRQSLDDFEVTMIVEHTEPGSALDGQLRRQQAEAVFDLLFAAKRRSDES